MALSAAERAKIRRYLGWSARFHQTDDMLEQAMNAMATQVEDELLIQADLVKLVGIDDELDGIVITAKATQLGGIQLRAAYQQSVLRERGRRVSNRVASALGVTKRGDAFGTTQAGLARYYGTIGGGRNNYPSQG